MLRLLAALCRAQGGQGLEDYEPPSAALPAALLAAPGPEPVGRGQERAAEVAAVAEELGGEAG